MGNQRSRPRRTDTGAARRTQIEGFVRTIAVIERMDGWGPYAGARIYTGRNFPSPEGIQMAQEVLAADTLTPRFLQEVYSLTYFPQQAWAYHAIDTIAGGLHLHRPDRVAELCFTCPVAVSPEGYRRTPQFIP